MDDPRTAPLESGRGSDHAEDILQTSDGGFVVAGTTMSFGSGFEDVYVVKLDAAGELEWSETYGGAAQDCCASIDQTSDGGYVLSGPTSSLGAGGYDLYVVRLDADAGPWSPSTSPPRIRRR